MGRFINADDYPSTGQGLTGNNMFAYCGNDPVNRNDESGTLWGIATLASAVVGGLFSGLADAAMQYVTTGTVDWGQTAIATVSGAISGACAMIPGGKVTTTLISGGINAALSAGSYALNQVRKGEKIETSDLLMNAGVGFASGVAGNLFRINSTSAMRDAGEELLEKGTRKLINGVANSSTSTIKRAFQYWDRGAELIYKYASRAGTNSGVGSVVGTILNAFVS